MGDEMEKDLLEILDPAIRRDVRLVAVQQLLGMTGSNTGCMYIGQRPKLLEAVLNMLFDNDKAIREGVEKLMVNLTAEERIVQALLAQTHVPALKKVTAHMVKQCLDPKLTNTSVCSVLSNMTRVSDCAVFVADVMKEDKSTDLASFIDGLCHIHAEKAPTFASVSTLLMNLTQVPSVRRRLMEPPAHLLLKLLSIMSLSSSLSACKGVIGAVQNCCFEYDYHGWLLSEEVDLLSRLLLPLAGPEEFDDEDMDKLPQDLQYLPDTKEREADPIVRGMLIKAVHQLCSTKAGRLYLKEHNTYIILRELHKWEKYQENIDSLYDVIDILIGDEPQAGMEDLHSVEIPPEVQEKFDKGE